MDGTVPVRHMCSFANYKKRTIHVAYIPYGHNLEYVSSVKLYLGVIITSYLKRGVQKNICKQHISRR